MKKLLILLDSDGVLSAYSKFFLDYLNLYNSYNGRITNYTPDSIKGWHIYDSLPEIEKESKKEVRKFIGKNALFIPEIPGAKEGVKYLKSKHDVVVVTRSAFSPTWMYDRVEWLQKKMSIPEKDVIFAARKELIQGAVFVDDSVENVLAWHKNNPNKLAVLFDQPSNRDLSKLSEEDKCLAESFRIVGWDNLIKAIDSL